MSLQFVETRIRMQTPTRMDKVVTLIYLHMATTMNDYMNWMKLAHVLSILSLNPKAPFVHLPLPQHS
jgi:hypothetical protein